MMAKSNLLLAITAALALPHTSAFAPPTRIIQHTPPTTQLHATTTNTPSSSSRRTLLTTALLTTAPLILANTPAQAATNTPPTPEELSRIKIGYENIQYLLANWEKETTVCRENGGECKRDADPVRKYLGLRSTTDPLFQIEKVFNKVKYMEDVDVDKLDDFFEATEDWNSAMSMSNSMAFISQFGEYNPGGGKDEVLKYLEESKKQVILAEKALRRILDTIESAGK